MNKRSIDIVTVLIMAMAIAFSCLCFPALIASILSAFYVSATGMHFLFTSSRLRRWRCRRKGHVADLRIIEQYNAVTLSDFEMLSTGLRTIHRLVSCKFHCPRCGATEIGTVGRVELWLRRTDSFSPNQNDE